MFPVPVGDKSVRLLTRLTTNRFPICYSVVVRREEQNHGNRVQVASAPLAAPIVGRDRISEHSPGSHRGAGQKRGRNPGDRGRARTSYRAGPRNRSGSAQRCECNHPRARSGDAGARRFRSRRRRDSHCTRRGARGHPRGEGAGADGRPPARGRTRTLPPDRNHRRQARSVEADLQGSPAGRDRGAEDFAARGGGPRPGSRGGDGTAGHHARLARRLRRTACLRDGSYRL